MDKFKAFGKGVVATVQSYPKGALIVWGVSLIAVIVLMWG